jgi:hypothetical protein
VEFKACHRDDKGVSAVRSAHPHIFNWFCVVCCVVTGGDARSGFPALECWMPLSREEHRQLLVRWRYLTFDGNPDVRIGGSRR